MNEQLKQDQQNQSELLQTAVHAATEFLATLPERKAAVFPQTTPTHPDLPETGLGAAVALQNFRKQFEAGLSGSAGPEFGRVAVDDPGLRPRREDADPALAGHRQRAAVLPFQHQQRRPARL